MSKTKSGGGFSSLVASLAIVIAVVIGVLVFKFILGDPSNFVDNNPEEHPIDGNILGTVYKGGVIVPFLIATNIIVIIFAVERFITLAKSKGRGNLDKFVVKVKALLEEGDINGAIEACDQQQGSLANVMRSGLEKYAALSNDTNIDKEKKLEMIKEELEAATSLELPMLSKNLVVISTCASAGVLIGLIGTVMGMIKSFAAMAGGTPDTAQLSIGISEALINTFLGIFASTLSIIMYNLFTTKIDQMTYSMDEASFAIAQSFDSKSK